MLDLPNYYLHSSKGDGGGVIGVRLNLLNFFSF